MILSRWLATARHRTDHVWFCQSHPHSWLWENNEPWFQDVRIIRALRWTYPSQWQSGPRLRWYNLVLTTIVMAVLSEISQKCVPMVLKGLGRFLLYGLSPQWPRATFYSSAEFWRWLFSLLSTALLAHTAPVKNMLPRGQRLMWVSKLCTPDFLNYLQSTPHKTW